MVWDKLKTCWHENVRDGAACIVAFPTCHSRFAARVHKAHLLPQRSRPVCSPAQQAFFLLDCRGHFWLQDCTKPFHHNARCLMATTH